MAANNEQVAEFMKTYSHENRSSIPSQFVGIRCNISVLSNRYFPNAKLIVLVIKEGAEAAARAIFGHCKSSYSRKWMSGMMTSRS